ncbi:ATP-dependent zinc metalloprotease FtsH [Huintestinicola sp.]|uniref:ATP-dependent zinc metalloprotease FtsH n=1 Tax=Huintestinicola sp. TaxID=2981661 RepID=UPI003D7E5B8E
MKKGSGLFIYIIIAIVLMFSMVYFLRQSSQPKSEYTYSQIMEYFDNYEVSKYTFDLGTGDLEMTVNTAEGTKEIKYTVPNVSIFIDEIQYASGGEDNYREAYNKLHPDAPLSQEYYKIQDNTWLYNVLPSLVLIILMVALFIFMMRQAGGGTKLNNFGKANIKNQSKKKNTFKDVAGADEEKQELAEIVDFLKNPKKYNDIGARIPKGVLLMGPPGTGKTLLAKAVAGEAGVPFFSISGSDFVEMFVGVGASRVRDLFETAKKNAPAIVFIDEIDAVGRQRGAGLGGGHDEREQTLNQLLVEMDGFEGNEGVIVIAAANRRDILDPALLRPGRFDREVMVGYPDVKGREEILKVHAKNKPLAPDVDLKVIAKTTQFFTGADLENLLNEAALLAARHDRRAITEEDIEEATLKVIAGPEKKSALVTDRDKKITAFHEAGHAVAAYYLPECEKVHQVTTIQRGQAAGLTVCRPETDDNHVTKGKMYQDIIMTMGGRVSEALSFDDVCTGASGDIQQATKRARAMVTQYGFSEKLGPVQYGGGNNEVFLGRDYGHTTDYSESTAALIDEEVKGLITKAYKECEALLKEHYDKVKELAEYLIEYEKIDGNDFEKLMKGELKWEKNENKPEDKADAEVKTEEKSEDKTEDNKE